MTISCQNNKFLKDDLPTKELIDSVVSYAIKASDLSVTHYSKKQIDSLFAKDSFVRPFHYLNSELIEWKIQSNHELNEELYERIKYFPYEYVARRLFEQDSLNLFNSEDSLYIIFQIKNKYCDTLDLKGIRNVSYTNCKYIEHKRKILKQNPEQWFKYCQISKPLFNKRKTIAIIGFSTIDYNSKRRNFEGGVLMIMKKEGKKWVFITDVDWWGH